MAPPLHSLVAPAPLESLPLSLPALMHQFRPAWLPAVLSHSLCKRATWTNPLGLILFNVLRETLATHQSTLHLSCSPNFKCYSATSRLCRPFTQDSEADQHVTNSKTAGYSVTSQSTHLLVDNPLCRPPRGSLSFLRPILCWPSCALSLSGC